MAYRNFKLAVYLTVGDVNHLAESDDIAGGWEFFEKHLQVNKVYLEAFRSDIYVKEDNLNKLKKFFLSRNITVSGGITTSGSAGKKRWNLFCYTSKKDLEKLEKVVKLTARHFDEVILDDFYFTDCRCPSCVKAKGDLSWDEFRTRLLADVSRNIVIKAAKEENPKVSMVIKFPNWYEHYQFTGYNLKDEPGIFDAVYTGTETRDAAMTFQNLPRYLSYFLMRYLDNTGKGKNNGGWFDTFDCYNPNQYSAQGVFTLLAKAKEITLFCYHLIKDTVYVPIIGHILEKIDPLLGRLGNPNGLACYKPFHSRGEDYLHNYLGMCSIPLEPYPEYPAEARNILLTQSAADDPLIIENILKSLSNGSRVILTSGFWKTIHPLERKKLASLWIDDRKISVNRFEAYTHHCSYMKYCTGSQPILFPFIEWATNDIWPVIAGGSGENTGALLLKQIFGDGELLIWNMPDHYSDLYLIPKEIWNVIRKELNHDSVWLETEPGVCLFQYDNNTVVIYSELNHPAEIQIVLPGSSGTIKNIINDTPLKGYEIDGIRKYPLQLNPGEWTAFEY